METVLYESFGNDVSRNKNYKKSGNCYKKHQKSLGKDEAPGSNLASSTISAKPASKSKFIIGYN